MCIKSEDTGRLLLYKRNSTYPPLYPCKCAENRGLQGFSYVENDRGRIGKCCHFAQKGKVNGLFMFNYKQS